MIFHRAKIKPTKEVIIGNDKITLTKTTNLLGIIFDDKLKWAVHITFGKKLIYQSTGILFKDKITLIKYIKQLYYSFAYPYVVYGIEIWENASNIYT